MPRDERHAESLERMQIGLPTLFVHGVEDELVPLARAEELFSKFSNGTMLKHHGAHYVPACSGEIKQTVVRFLEAVREQSQQMQC